MLKNNLFYFSKWDGELSYLSVLGWTMLLSCPVLERISWDHIFDIDGGSWDRSSKDLIALLVKLVSAWSSFHLQLHLNDFCLSNRMGKLNIFEITLSNFQGVFYAGQNVQGHCTIELNEEMSMRGKLLEFQITCHCALAFASVLLQLCW